MSTLASVEGPPQRLDRRVRKTRKGLGDALLSLCAVKPYEAITVQDIIDRADVSRSTFYAHYVDKDGLLLDAFRGLRDHSRDGHESRAVGDELFGWSLEVFRWTAGVIDDFGREAEAFRSLMVNPACVLVIAELEQEIAARSRADLARLADLRPERVPPVVLGFVVGAFMSILSWWLESRDRRSPDEIDQVFRMLVIPGTAAALGISVPEQARTRALGLSKSMMTRKGIPWLK
jgi:AcrR family transcriptional regulator